jgi:hypothetical protein
MSMVKRFTKSHLRKFEESWLNWHMVDQYQQKESYLADFLS